MRFLYSFCHQKFYTFQKFYALYSLFERKGCQIWPFRSIPSPAVSFSMRLSFCFSSLTSELIVFTFTLFFFINSGITFLSANTSFSTCPQRSIYQGSMQSISVSLFDNFSPMLIHWFISDTPQCWSFCYYGKQRLAANEILYLNTPTQRLIHCVLYGQNNIHRVDTRVYLDRHERPHSPMGSSWLVVLGVGTALSIYQHCHLPGLKVLPTDIRRRGRRRDDNTYVVHIEIHEDQFLSTASLDVLAGC